ncbi:MAG: FtsX-like permease family protein [Nitrospirota bacterium]
MAGEFNLLTFAVKNLKRKQLRTWILVAAIALLVSVLVFAFSFVRRVNSSIRLTSERLGADVIVVPAGSRGAAEDVLLENRTKSFYMDKGIIDRVKVIKGVDNLTHQTYLVTMTGLCCDVPESMVIAFNQETDFIVKPWLKGKLSRTLRKGEAIVGHESAFNINVGLMEVDSVLFGNVFKMVGVLDKSGIGFDNAIFLGDENINDIIEKGKTGIKPGQMSIIFLKVKKGFDPYKVARDIDDAIVEVDAVARKDIGKNIINTLRDISRIFSLTIVIASLLAAFLAWAVFSAIANERAREVGIMRALGAKESHVVRLFLSEVLLVGTAGSILGIICGTTLSFFLSKGFSIMKNLAVDLSLSDRVFIGLAGLVIGTAVCVIGALSPVQRLKKMEPLVVIKGE